MADETIRIVPYDPTWAERFEQESAALTDAIGEWVPAACTTWLAPRCPAWKRSR